MNQCIVCDSSCEVVKYLIDVNEESWMVASVTDIDCITNGSLCATIKDEIDIKELLDSIHESHLNCEIKICEPLKSGSSNLKV